MIDSDARATHGVSPPSLAWPGRCGQWVCHALLLGLLCGLPPVLAQVAAPPATVFVIATDAPPEGYVSRFLTLTYSEAFRRLGIAFRLENYALKRQGLQMEAGSIDGEANRAYGYGATQPHLVRVEESLLDLHLALFSANPALHLQKLEDLASSALQVEYRRGLLLCENALKPWVAQQRLSDIATEDLGLKKLLARRTDLYCDFTLTVAQALRQPDFKGSAPVVKVMNVGKVIPTYPYLNKRHAELAPALAAVLKKMKAEGLLETYRLRVERELAGEP